MKDSSFLVRINKNDHDRFRLALSLYGGSQSGVAEKLVCEWSKKVILEAGVMYGFKRGDDYVSFFKLSAEGEVEKVEFGAPIGMRLNSVVTLDYLRELAAKMNCKLVRLD